MGNGGLPGLGGGRNRWSPEDAQGRVRTPCDPGVVAVRSVHLSVHHGDPSAKTEVECKLWALVNNCQILALIVTNVSHQ